MKRIAIFLAAMMGPGLVDSVAPAMADYAIAYGKMGTRWGFGSSNNAGSLEAAKKQALELCDMKTCKVVMTGRGQCVAVSISRDNGFASWISGESLQKVREDALVECSASARKCTIQASFCDRASAAPSPTPPSSSAPAQPARQTPPSPSPTNSSELKDRLYGTSPLGSAPPSKTPADPNLLTADELKAFVQAVRACWVVDPDKYPKETRIAVGVELNPDGTLASSPKIVESYVGARAEFADYAIMAIINCAPYNGLPAEKYNTWKSMELMFNPNAMRK